LLRIGTGEVEISSDIAGPNDKGGEGLWRVTPIPEDICFIGVDGCKSGWLAVMQSASIFEEGRVEIFRTFADLIEGAPNSAIIAVDMPIGLPDTSIGGGREPELAVRSILGPRRSSVFSVPSRSAVYAFSEGYAKVCSVARATSMPPWAPSKQAFWIFPRIQDVDRVLRADKGASARVFEVHPELAFRVMNGAPLLEPKKRKGRCHEPGMQLRRDLLKRQGFASTFLDRPPPRGAARDDFYDACACTWSARRLLASKAMVFPSEPSFDAHGLVMAIWA
jgi:predicted RNase H-like nuclease